MLKRVRKGLLLLSIALLVLTIGAGDYRPSALELAVAPHRFSLVRWELSNFPDKWVHKLGSLLPWSSRPTWEERIARVQEYLTLGQQKRDLERQLEFPIATASRTLSAGEDRLLRADIQRLEERRNKLQAGVEETIESEISAVVAQEGFASRIGLIFPPVDAVLNSTPTVLVLSPRDRIERAQTILLAPGLSNDQRERIEEFLLREENLSALVEDTGGLAAYPSVVSDSGGLLHVLEVTAHEWLHHWFFFQPLGQHFWDSPEMITLNETAATLGGREIGDRAYTALTGEPVRRKPNPPPDASAFDFSAAMRETRLRAEELLAAGRIDEAEAYMEERRQVMAANGFLIRKINQAFFAFHGSYATSSASVSPVDKQLRELRSRSESLGDFLRTVARFATYQEFLDYLEQTRPPAAPPG